MKRKGAGPLFRIQHSGKWGYMDRSGRTQIKPKFAAAGDFFGGLAAVLVGEKDGFINEKGEVVIPPQFDGAGDFLGELAPVRIGRKWGYIDKSGKIVVEPRFQGAGEFYEGMAKVLLWDKAVCESGKEYTKEDAPMDVFEPSVYTRCFPSNGRYGFIDKTGSLVIPARFAFADDFSEGLSVVHEEIEGKAGYIGHSGSFAIPPQFNHADSFSEGLAGVEVRSRIEGEGRNRRVVDIERGYIDKTGRLAIPAVYDFVGSFSEGLSRVSVKLGEMGYIDRSGKMVISPRFQIAWDFSDGLAVACDDAACTYINRSGSVAIKNLKAPNLAPFSDGLAISPIMGSRQNYIDTRGRIVAGYNYQKRLN